MSNIDIHKAAAIMIRGRNILVVRAKGKGHFIDPGGKLETGESPQQALIRELSEEIAIKVRESDLVFFGTFFAPAAGQEDKMLQMDAFIVTRWQGEPTATSEIEQIAWINSDIPKNMQVGSIFEHEIIPRLKAQNLID